MLDIGTENTGDFVPWVKYNSKAGRWYIKDDAGNDLEVDKPVFVADFAEIKTGWFYFSAGAAPERVLDPSLTSRAPKPDKTFVDEKGKTRDCFKRGFALNVFSEKAFGGVCELSSVANAICAPIGELYEKYANAAEKEEGKLPVVQFVKANAITGKHGTNYEPVFDIVKWVDRPTEFDASTNDDTTTNTPTPEPEVMASSGASEF